MTSRTRQVLALGNKRKELRQAKSRPAGMAVARAVAKCLAPGSAKGGGASAAMASVPGSAPLVAPRTNRASDGAARGVRRAASPRSDQARIAELKVKLRDDDYMNGAILRIATVLSARLTLR